MRLRNFPHSLWLPGPTAAVMGMALLLFSTTAAADLATEKRPGNYGTLQPEDELQDDFSDGWKDCLWKPYTRQGGQVTYHENWNPTDQSNPVFVRGGKLEMELPANKNPGQTWELGLESKFMLSGDFTVEVDYELSSSNYRANLDMRGINLLFIELMAGDQGTRRRHVRRLDFGLNTDDRRTTAHLWLSNDGHNTVTQIDTDARKRLREIPVGQRPGRTAVDLLGNVYVHNRGSGYKTDSGDNSHGTNTKTTVTFIKASACLDPECDLNSPEGKKHVYTLDFSGGDFDNRTIYNGKYGGGVAVDRNNDLWVAFREPGQVWHLEYHPSDIPGGDTWTLKKRYNIRQQLNRHVRIYGIAMARDGNLWLATRGSAPEALVELNTQSGVATAYVPPADDTCINTYGIAIDDKQRLFWATFSNCKGFRLDPSKGNVNSAWIRLEANPQSDQQGARGMAADSQGRVWSAVDTKNKVIAFDQETGKMVFSRNTCKAPAGVALDRNNLLWVSCRLDSESEQVQVYNMQGEFVAKVPAKNTYTYSDMTGYQLRNFGLEDWEESFLVGQGEITGTYYTSSVVNNYGGGIELGAGGDAILDPTEATFYDVSGGGAGASRPQAQRMRVGTQYYTDQVPLIAEHPARLEGVWGFRMPATFDLGTSPLKFRVKEESYVYVAIEEGADPVPDWARGTEGWASTNEAILTTDSQRSYVLYRKLFAAGEEVVLRGANEYAGTPPVGAPFLNYFVYVYPTVLDGRAPQSPEAFVDDPPADVRDRGRLRIARQGNEWRFSYLDAGVGVWRTMTRSAGPVTDVPIRLRTRLDPFWHAGPHNNLGGAIYARFDNFAVTEVVGVPGGPYCREGCDETVPGYGATCIGGPSGLCPGNFACVDDELTCVPEIRPERCNGLDDDCDGWVDHNRNNLDFPVQEVTSGGHTHIVENHGMPGPNPDGPGDVYEGHQCTTTLSGPCAEGFWQCVQGAMVCQPFEQPQPDWCNNIDNSCIGDDPEDQELLDPLVRIDRYVLISQRSAPNTPIRPVVGALEGDQGVSFTTWAGFDGSNVNPQREGVVKAGKARIILYLDRTLTGPGSHPQLGSYVLWLAHGERSPSQGAASASYMIAYTRNSSARNLIMQDGVVREGVVAPSDQAQFVTVQSGEGQSGGVALGPFPATEDWAIDLSAHFTGDIDGWELYSATTGEVMELSPNETLSFSNNKLTDNFYGALTMEVGSECDTGEHGICGRGTSRCVKDADDNWGLTCLPGPVPQLEVCDGRDNSCTGEIDNDQSYGFAVPMVQYQLLPSRNAEIDESAWQPLTTVDQAQSALDYLNFRRRGVAQGAAVGSPDIVDVTDKDRSIQAVDRSVFAVHRDMRRANGTLSLVMAHGKYVEEPESTVPGSSASVNTTFYQPRSAENFLGWIDDLADQEDGSALTPKDSASRVPQPIEVTDPNHFEYRMNWELHRWVTGGAARREADGGVIMDLFPEKTDRTADFRPMLEMSSSGLNQWRLHSPYATSNSLENIPMNRTVAFRVYTATSHSYFGSPTAPTCIIQENDVPGCLGQEDHYMCNDGVLTCGLGTAGCCSPDHPLYDTPCGLDDDEFINVGACRSALRCREDGGWQCEQVVSPQPEVCDGFDNTCDGIVDGFVSGFVDAGGREHRCPGGAERCGPAECDYLQICQCAPGDDAPECACVAALEEILHSPYERICEDYERLEEDRCVPVGTLNE